MSITKRQGCSLRKLVGAQCSGCPVYDFYEKSYDSLVTQEQKLGARGHQAMPEHRLERAVTLNNFMSNFCYAYFSHFLQPFLDT